MLLLNCKKIAKQSVPEWIFRSENPYVVGSIPTCGT